MQTKCLKLKYRGATLPVVAVKFRPQNTEQTAHIEEMGYSSEAVGFIFDESYAEKLPGGLDQAWHIVRVAGKQLTRDWDRVGDCGIVDGNSLLQ